MVAFCQVYDQDVIVHLPRIQNFDRDSISYTNEHRETPVGVPALHICYGGDEVTRAHYDSARSRDGSTPRSQNSPRLMPQDAIRNAMGASPSPGPGLLSTRAIRSGKADLSSELIHNFLQASRKELESNMDQLIDKYRARSPSVTSSQRSSSSKRSLDDDGEPIRSSKRADRRKSMRRRANMTITTSDLDNELSPRLPTDSPNADTPPSTQDTELSSDVPVQDYDGGMIKTTSITIDDERNVFDTAARVTKSRVTTQSRTSYNVVTTSRAAASESASPRLMSVAERPKSTLRA